MQGAKAKQAGQSEATETIKERGGNCLKSCGRGGNTAYGYISKIEQTEFSDRLDVGEEEQGKSVCCSKCLGLSTSKQSVFWDKEDYVGLVAEIKLHLGHLRF